jgi:hypothetical protein
VFCPRRPREPNNIVQDRDRKETTWNSNKAADPPGGEKTINSRPSIVYREQCLTLPDSLTSSPYFSSADRDSKAPLLREADCVAKWTNFFFRTTINKDEWIEGVEQGQEKVHLETADHCLNKMNAQYIWFAEINFSFMAPSRFSLSYLLARVRGSAVEQ